MKKFQIPVANAFVGKEEANEVYSVVKSGWISMGKKVEEFENSFSKYVDSKHSIAVNNGTSALHIALIAMGIKDGDEVLVPDITYITTSNVVLYERATPILVECDPDTYNISLEDAEKRITNKTKAIIPVDMNGLPVDYDNVLAFAKKHNLKVIADSAESLGCSYKGKRNGAIAPIHMFSFFPNKAITTGEGGMITTNNDQLADELRKLRNHGQSYRYNHIMLGYNYRMPDVLAAIGIQQLKKINYITSKKEEIANTYTNSFNGHKLIKPPYLPDYATNHSWYMYPITLDKNIDRDLVVKKLKEKGIDTRLSFPPIHIQPYYMERFNFKEDSYPVSLAAWKSLIDLPVGVDLTPEEQKYVIDSLLQIVDEVAN